MVRDRLVATANEPEGKASDEEVRTNQKSGLA